MGSLLSKGEVRVLDSLELANLTKVDQGNHEAEVSYGGEADLHRHLNQCHKNPGHPRFIPVYDFSMDHLPERYQTKDMYQFIKAMSRLIVRVSVRHTSVHRPKKYPDTNLAYPFHNTRGSNFLRTGTGWIRLLVRQFKKEDNRSCPCYSCKSSGDPKHEWCEVVVKTAKHVVFDSDEAQHTTCELFYDHDKERSTIQKLEGLDVYSSNTGEDWCWLLCVSHDVSLWDQLQELSSARRALSKKVKMGGDSGVKDNLVVIVSHPHGCSKQISVGEWTYRQQVGKYGHVQYTYTTATCPGSSGAPVMVMGQQMSGARFVNTGRPHSCSCQQPGLNLSAGGWDF